MPESTTALWILIAVCAFSLGGIIGIFTMAILAANREPDEIHLGVETDAPREGR